MAGTLQELAVFWNSRTDDDQPNQPKHDSNAQDPQRYHNGGAILPGYRVVVKAEQEQFPNRRADLVRGGPFQSCQEIFGRIGDPEKIGTYFAFGG